MLFEELEVIKDSNITKEIFRITLETMFDGKEEQRILEKWKNVGWIKQKSIGISSKTKKSF